MLSGQQGMKRVDIAAQQPRKGGDAVCRRRPVDLAPAGEEIGWRGRGYARSVPHCRPRSRRDGPKRGSRAARRHAAATTPNNSFRRHIRSARSGLGEDPAAAQAAEAIDLGEAVGGDELRAEMRGRARARRCVEIDLVDQHARRRASPIARSVSSSARLPDGIVEIGEQDQPGPRRDMAGNRVGIEPEACRA